MAITVRITETYDLKTTLNNMGIIGIHTPTPTMINMLYPGLCKQYKFVRLVKADVVGVCASTLPVDPLQISDGAIAPEDMFNPLLYRAVTNSSFETITARARAGSPVGIFGSVDTVTSAPAVNNPFNVYYSLLAGRGFKKAMPQSGFKMTALRPLCHTLVSSYGQLAPPKNVGLVDGAVGEPVKTSDGDDAVLPDLTASPVTSRHLNNSIRAEDNVIFRGRPVPYPRIPLHYAPESMYEVVPGDGSENFVIPKTMVGVIIVPPARATIFAYRVRVSWTVRFEGLISTLDIANSASYNLIGPASHSMNWNPSATALNASAELSTVTDSIDTEGVDINKIMES